jgi:transcriptional regulator with XRE-family HTH domain
VNGQELRQRRERLGLSQAQLAAALGTTQNTISRWELNEITIEKPQMLAWALEAIETRIKRMRVYTPVNLLEAIREIKHRIDRDFDAVEMCERLNETWPQLNEIDPVNFHTVAQVLHILTGPGYGVIQLVKENKQDSRYSRYARTEIAQKHRDKKIGF